MTNDGIVSCYVVTSLQPTNDSRFDDLTIQRSEIHFLLVNLRGSD